ncbi:MAG: rhodanese-like domain-containing protein [Candidatus Neomarinimicrobiota bacterium]|tara:strand:+ start:438 stop:746 length:309 start_codon:yes stop_codon:yes gene_type:complete
MEVEVLKLKKMLDNNEVILLDVREPYEVEICHVKGSLFIPMNEIPQKLEQLDKEKNYAVMCHSGVRSLHVSNYLNSQGFIAMNVSGGIDMWSLSVDKNIKRY